MNRLALHLGGAAGNADNNTRRGGEAAVVYLADEMLEHFLGNIEIGNHPVLHRAHRLDTAGCTPQHALGFRAHRHRGVFIVAHVVGQRHHRRFVQNDTAAFDVNQGVGRT